jgi:hypothetical protein
MWKTRAATVVDNGEQYVELTVTWFEYFSVKIYLFHWHWMVLSQDSHLRYGTEDQLHYDAWTESEVKHQQRLGRPNPIPSLFLDENSSCLGFFKEFYKKAMDAAMKKENPNIDFLLYCWAKSSILLLNETKGHRKILMFQEQDLKRRLGLWEEKTDGKFPSDPDRNNQMKMEAKQKKLVITRQQL